MEYVIAAEKNILKLLPLRLYHSQGHPYRWKCSHEPCLFTTELFQSAKFLEPKLQRCSFHQSCPPPFFYVLCSFCLSSCSQTKEKLGNTQTCFKNTYVLDQPQTSWSNWSRHYPGIAIFQSSLGDPNAQPGWGATGHPFSSVNLPDSPFLPVPKLMTKSRSWKWESSRYKCPRPETPSGRMRRERPLDTYLWFLSLLSFSPLLPEHFLSFRISVTSFHGLWPSRKHLLAEVLFGFLWGTLSWPPRG